MERGRPHVSVQRAAEGVLLRTLRNQTHPWPAARQHKDRHLPARPNPVACCFQLLQCSVTGPAIGCSPVPRSRACFSAKYHFAGLSASSISISAGPYFSPAACSTIVSWSWRTNIPPKNFSSGRNSGNQPSTFHAAHTSIRQVDGVTGVTVVRLVHHLLPARIVS